MIYHIYKETGKSLDDRNLEAVGVIYPNFVPDYISDICDKFGCITIPMPHGASFLDNGQFNGRCEVGTFVRIEPDENDIFVDHEPDEPEAGDDDVPPDPEGMNDARAGWAEIALEAFMAETHTDPGDAICDLLSDLMHLCDRDRETYGKFSSGLDRARMHYEEETTDIEEDED